MPKIKLGNDFTDENDSDNSKGEESDEKTTDDESEDEEKTSADPDNSKKTDEDESEDESADDDKKDEEDTTASDSGKTEDEKVEEKPQDKAAILQGLLDTEKNLDKDVTDIDVSIAAARQRISQKRGDRREKRDLVNTIDSKFPDIKEDENTDDLSDIDPETIKVLDRFTKAKGLVPKSELARMSYQDQHKNAQEAFYSSHPEYLPDNDPDNVLYDAIKKELSYFVAPSDAKLIPALFAKAHDAVVKQFPDKFKGKKADNKEVSNDQINKSVRIKTQGLGGKSSGGDGGGDKTLSTKKSFSVEQIRALENGGWSAEEIKTLTG